jgi:DNA-binding NarL/FixJ family response regulator
MKLGYQVGALELTQLPSSCLVDFKDDFSHREVAELESVADKPAGNLASSICIGWIDSFRLTQECIMRALVDLEPRAKVTPFSSIKECVDEPQADFDLLLYYSHRSDGSCLENVAALRKTFKTVQIIVLSDTDDTDQLKMIRNTLTRGIDGFISTKTTGVPMALAAIRFVQAGGTFAPFEVLVTDRTSRSMPAAEPAHPARLTSRQMAVLCHLQQGKANKIIAHELGMSESTVKVHVRNIMRKMGATNRTQAAFKALGLCNDPEEMRLANA